MAEEPQSAFPPRATSLRPRALARNAERLFTYIRELEAIAVEISHVTLELSRNAKQTNPELLTLAARSSRIMGRSEDLHSDVQMLLDFQEIMRSYVRLKDVFFSIISHDLRAPMFGHVTLLEQTLSQKDRLSRDELIVTLEKALTNSLHQSTMLDNLLKWARLQMGQLQMQPRRFSAQSSIQQALGLFDQNIEQKRLRLILEITEPAHVYADPNMFESIVRNLLSNAIKYSDEGGTLRVRAGTAQRFELEVSNSGPGIAPDLLERLFEAERAFENMPRSGGIGLILSLELARKNHGLLEAASEPGQGASFRLTLPHSEI